MSMKPADRGLRADAERNRRRLLDAAEALFRERGLDVGVAEIAERAGVGRGTLFRNFPSKEDLIAAIVVERMHEATAYTRTMLDAPDAGEALFGFLEEMVGRQQLDRCLFDAVADSVPGQRGDPRRPRRDRRRARGAARRAPRKPAPSATTSGRWTS